MQPKIPRLSKGCRARLLKRGAASADPATCLRFRAIVHLAEGKSCHQAAAALLCAVSTVVRAGHAFLEQGENGLLDHRRHNGQLKLTPAWLKALAKTLTKVPTQFGWRRPTWTRELLCLELERRGFSRVSVASMGRALAAIEARLKRPKATVSCPWKAYKREKVRRELRRLAKGCSAKEPVFFEDEVDIHLNPKLGLDWMLKGKQRKVKTPGKNEKRYAAGALHASTRRLVSVVGPRKASALFCELLEKLVATYKRAVRIHLILDNYVIHSSKITQQCLEKLGEKVVLHFLPPYCPDDNRIERLWQDLHANVTRNHRCKSMDELMREVLAFLDAYNHRDVLNPSLRRAA